MPPFTLTVTATGQQGEIEEVTETGFYLRVNGHARYFDADLVTHPAPDRGETEETR